MMGYAFQKFAMVHAALLLCCGCVQQQQGWNIPWGKDSLYTWEEIAAKEIESQEYRHQILDAAIKASSISLEQHYTHNNTRRKRTIHLHPKEQETLRMLLFKATYHPVKNDTSIHATLPAEEWTELIITDRQGKKLYHDTVKLCKESQVSKDGYALGAYLALSDEDFRLWKRILYQESSAPTVQEHEAATAQHRQAVKDLHALLTDCKTAEVWWYLNSVTACGNHKLNELETRQLCTLLRRCQPIPFLGNISGLREREIMLHFYNEAGEQIGSFKARDITDAASARNQQHCTEQESMYLSTQDYTTLQKLICHP